MIFSARLRNISFTPWPVLALELKCWLPTFIAYLFSRYCLSYLPFSLIERDLSIRYIAFISCDDDGGLRWEELLKLLHPDVYFSPRLEICDIVHYQRSYILRN